MLINVSQVQSHPHFFPVFATFNGFMTGRPSLLHFLTQPEATTFLISCTKKLFHPYSWDDFQKKLVQVVPQMARHSLVQLPLTPNYLYQSISKNQYFL